MASYERHIFVCTNARDPATGKGCCASKGADEVVAALKESLRECGKGRRIRINRAGCLGQCAAGVTAVVYPEGYWYRGLSVGDADQVVREHLVNGEPVERLALGTNGNG
jgi:(2Fe-2S) ferredoxin